MYHNKESTTRGYTQFFNLGYAGSSHLGVVDYEAQIGLSYEFHTFMQDVQLHYRYYSRIPHLQVMAENSLKGSTIKREQTPSLPYREIQKNNYA
jgi:hypothetical protein